MAYLSDMGFRGGEWDIWQNYLAIEERGELIVAGDVKYLRLAVDDRLEMWTRFADGQPDIHIHSYYRGDSRFPVVLYERTERASRLRSDGAFLCRSKPLQGDGWYAGQIPIVFDVPDYHRYDNLPLPRVSIVQLTASALGMTGYADEDEFLDAYPPDDEGYGWGARHFVPVCWTEPRGEKGELQESAAAVSGFVLDTAILTNPLTGIDFCWALVETICGVVDVVCSPNDLEGYLHKGGVATASCLLTGRILDCAVR
jgi:hypothetical protein